MKRTGIDRLNIQRRSLVISTSCLLKVHVYHATLLTNWKFKSGYTVPTCTKLADTIFLNHRSTKVHPQVLDNSRDHRTQHDYIIFYLPILRSPSTGFRVIKYSCRVSSWLFGWVRASLALAQNERVCFSISCLLKRWGRFCLLLVQSRPNCMFTLSWGCNRNFSAGVNFLGSTCLPMG